MSDLYSILASLCESRGITAYKMCKDVGIQPSIMTDLKMGRRNSMKIETANKIANYFGVTTDYLLTGEEKAPTDDGERKISEEDVKLALFGGDGEVTDAMWDEAQFAIQLIKERYKRKKDANE